MQVRFSNKFKKEINSITDEKLAKAVFMAIENVKISTAVHNINGIKKLKGHKNCFRIRIGEYRIGLYLDGKIIEFVRFLNRKEIYKYFP